jgi:hypothetical protein
MQSAMSGPVQGQIKLEYSEVVYGPLVYVGCTHCLKPRAPGFEDAGSSPAGSTTSDSQTTERKNRSPGILSSKAL